VLAVVGAVRQWRAETVVILLSSEKKEENHIKRRFGAHRVRGTVDVPLERPTSISTTLGVRALMGSSADFKSLEDELIDNVEKDVRYWQQNDAKLRAVKSVSTYQEFR